LLPVLGKAKIKAQAVKCMNNTKQLTLGWIIYSSDNNEKLMPNPGWVGGSMGWGNEVGNTNSAVLIDTTASVMASYVKSTLTYKCPADNVDAANGPRVRSYSMNGALSLTGSGPNFLGDRNDTSVRQHYAKGSAINTAAHKTYDLQIPGASQVFVVLDEQADSLSAVGGDATFMHDPGSKNQQKWRDLPASYHNRRGSFSYADGHSDIHKWEDSRTVWTVQRRTDTPWRINLGVSVDYEWMQDHMPYRPAAGS